MSAPQSSAPRHRFTDLVTKAGLALLLGMGAIVVVGGVILSIASVALTGALELDH